jgi:hypothetical protein
MQLKVGVVNQEDKRPDRKHILTPAKLEGRRSDAFCNLPAVIKHGTRPAKTKDEKALPTCGLCTRAVVKRGLEVPA